MKALYDLAENAILLTEARFLVRIYENDTIQEFIVDLNRKNQLFDKGININDKIIGRYSLNTQFVNPEKIAGDPYTLKDTGEFFSTFRINIDTDGGFTIFADDAKEKDNLTEKYPDILGLTNESTDKLIEQILPFFIQYTKEQLLS